MVERLDALMVRKGSADKSYFTKIGAAFPNRSGSGWTVVLEAMPAPEDGQYRILLMEPRDRPEAAPGGAKDEDIPF